MKPFLVASLVLFALASCTKIEETVPPASPSPSAGGAAGSAAAPAPGAKDPKNDYSQPYLTEEKVKKFLESTKEEKNPLEEVLKSLAGGKGAMELFKSKDRIEAFNAFAKKYGFSDYTDYTAVWGRMIVGSAMAATQGMMKSSEKMIQDMMMKAEEQLKKPDLTPEMRKMYEDHVASNKKSLEDMRKSQKSNWNEQDAALIAKYKPQIDEAMKKFGSGIQK